MKKIFNLIVMLISLIGLLSISTIVIVIVLLYCGVPLDTAIISTLLPHFLVPMLFGLGIMFMAVKLLIEMMIESLRNSKDKKTNK